MFFGILTKTVKCGEDEIIIDYYEKYNIESTTVQAGNEKILKEEGVCLK